MRHPKPNRDAHLRSCFKKFNTLYSASRVTDGVRPDDSNNSIMDTQWPPSVNVGKRRGIAVIAVDEQVITIILFMRKEVREQWHRSSKGTGHYRSQQHAPPADLPPLTISIFSDGSAMPRKIGQPALPAGYGVVAVCGGCPLARLSLDTGSRAPLQGPHA